MYKNVVFDVDGTLINTEQSIVKGLQKVLFNETGLLYSPEDLDFVLGVPGSYSIKTLGLNNPSRILAEWDKSTKAHADRNSIYEGIPKLIEALKKMGINLGIVTSRRDSECDNDPLFASLKDQFDFIVTADRTTKHKPEAEPLLYYLQNTLSEPADTLYIGDTSYDSACARKAGTDFMVAGWGAKNIDSIPNKDVLAHPYELLKYVSR